MGHCLFCCYCGILWRAIISPDIILQGHLNRHTCFVEKIKWFYETLTDNSWVVCLFPHFCHRSYVSTSGASHIGSIKIKSKKTTGKTLTDVHFLHIFTYVYIIFLFYGKKYLTSDPIFHSVHNGKCVVVVKPETRRQICFILSFNINFKYKQKI